MDAIVSGGIKMKKAGIIITAVLCALMVAAGIVIANKSVSSTPAEVTSAPTTTTTVTTQTEAFSGVGFAENTDETKAPSIPGSPQGTAPVQTQPPAQTTQTGGTTTTEKITDFWQILNEGAREE